MPQLIYNLGKVDERAFSIGVGACFIGRAVECEICIVHRSLSRRHAQIEHANGTYTLVDLGSKNGSFVNDIKIERHELRSGDVIRVGDIVLVFAKSGDSRSDSRRSDRSQDSSSSQSSGPALAPTLVKDFTGVALEDLLLGLRLGQVSAGPDEEAIKRAQRRLQVLLEVSRLLASRVEIDVLLEQLLELAFRVLNVDRGAILLLDQKTLRLEPRVLKSKVPVSIGANYSKTIVDYIYAKGVAALFCDPVRDARLDISDSVLHLSIRSSMGVPLRPKDQTIGVLYVDNLTTPNCFEEEDLEFLAAFANQAAVVIENSTLYQRIEEETTTRMQRVMEAKLASLGAVVSGIAHELNNPLNFISNFAELSVDLTGELGEMLDTRRISMDPELRGEIDDVLRMLRDNAAKVVDHGHRAKGIIDGMLRHARRGTGVRAKGDLNAVLVKSLRAALAGAGFSDPSSVQIDELYDATLEPVQMVSEDVSQVFMNLIRNACYAMREKAFSHGPDYTPALLLRTHDRGDRVEVVIRDNGTGIPAEIAEKIYNPFFTTKPPGAGTGLGLSISHDIVVEGHQGKMQMNSSPGEFTEFVLTLPKTSAPVEPSG